MSGNSANGGCKDRTACSPTRETQMLRYSSSIPLLIPGSGICCLQGSSSVVQGDGSRNKKDADTPEPLFPYAVNTPAPLEQPARRNDSMVQGFLANPERVQRSGDAFNTRCNALLNNLITGGPSKEELGAVAENGTAVGGGRWREPKSGGHVEKMLV
ncbi:hypothetical protein N431DRAFT_534956 [Stipitochalara longipes BDJ]|nr:hypothetical protein N431DRAFT_534956 [Stipitochalara longipes BDJ]